MKIRHLFCSAVSALALLSAAPALAAPATTPVPASAGFNVPPLGYQHRVLENGLEVYSRPDSNTANVAVQVWYRVGGKDDPSGRSGFAHLFEHLMFKATENVPSETFDRLTEDVGGYNNAFTSDDVTAYHEVVPANHLERILFAEADRMSTLVVDEENFVSERDVVKEEYRQGVLANPYGRLFRLFVPATFYEEHPYRRGVIGSIEELEAASLEDVLRFHRTYYRPDNAILIVDGNFDEAQLNQWVDQYFAPLTNPDFQIPTNNVVEPQRTAPKDATFYAPNVPLPAIVLGWHTVPANHPDKAALSVLDGILSTGDSSRLHRALVYGTQAAAEASSSLDASAQAGHLSVYALMSGDNSVEDGQRLLQAEVARLRDEPVTAAELSEAKNELIAAALSDREGSQGRASVLGWALINTGDAATADTEVAAIQAVTAQDVQRVARQYLTPERQMTIRYLQADENHPATAQTVNMTAPVTVAALAPMGTPSVLKPEGQRRPLPQPAAEVVAATPAVSEIRLDNGLRVLIAPQHNLPLISARLSFNAGAARDPQGKAGLASMTAAMLNQGTRTRSAPQIATETEQLGASIGASADADFLNVYAGSPANVFGQTMALLGDMVQNPAFSAEELDRQRTQALDGLELSLSQPGAIAGMVGTRLTFGGTAYGGVATERSLNSLTAQDLADFHGRYFRPDQAILTLSGDVTEQTARQLAEQTFGQWRATRRDAIAPVQIAADHAAPRVVVIDLPGAGQAAVSIASRSIARDDATYFPLTLGNTLLGGSYTSRLNQEIRINRGLSYGARSSIGARAESGLFTAATQTKNESATEVVDLLLAEVARMGQTRASDSELNPRRSILIGEFGRNLETVDGLGATVANLAAFNVPLSEMANYANRIKAVSAEQVEQAFADKLPANRANIVVVGDARLFIDSLRAKYPNVEVIAASALNLDTDSLR